MELYIIFVKSINYYSLATKHVHHGANFVSDDSCTIVFSNSFNLATESNKPLIHRDNSLRKVNLAFKRGFIVIKLAKISRHCP